MSPGHVCFYGQGDGSEAAFNRVKQLVSLAQIISIQGLDKILSCCGIQVFFWPELQGPSQEASFKMATWGVGRSQPQNGGANCSY